MATFKKFEDIEGWQKSRQLTKQFIDFLEQENSREISV
jgi:hypothetical protein